VIVRIAFVAGLLSYSALLSAQENDYERFTQEVVVSLERKDASAMALLVHFPLQVNLPDETTILIADELSLKRRFDQIFPPAFRRFVVETEKAGTGESGWAGGGYMLDHGALWAQNYPENEGPPGLRIQTVNAFSGTKTKDHAPRETLFACETPKERILIDSLANAAGILRYRSWDRPHFPPDAPDFSVTGGNREMVGTGTCAHDVWRFNKGGVEISVEENRCSADAPAKASRAIVTLRAKDGEKKTLGCF
jgi:hypothetical protein